MTKERLKAYQTNKRIYDQLGKELEDLHDRLDNLKIVSGQVQKSDDEWPYLRGHMQVEIQDPKPADNIQKKIIEHEQRRVSIKKELQAVETYISQIEDDSERQIFEWIYIDGLTQEEVGEVIGYTQARVSQIIDEAVKEV